MMSTSQIAEGNLKTCPFYFIVSGVHVLQKIMVTSSPEDVLERQNLVECESPACIFFTSGTTGHPKASAISHFTIVNEINQSWGTDCDQFYERLCVPVPIYFIYGYMNATMHIL